MEFDAIHNALETPVCEAVQRLAERYPLVAPEQLPDVACVALNRLTPRYIRHSVDLAFYEGAAERQKTERTVRLAVQNAFEFVQAREAMRARTR